MTVYVICLAYEGEIAGVFTSKAEAEARGSEVSAARGRRPYHIEEHRIIAEAHAFDCPTCGESCDEELEPEPPHWWDKQATT